MYNSSICDLTGKITVCIGKYFAGTTVEMDHIDVVPHMDRWPSFHNGVAAGLRIPTGHGNIDSNWITFNKPKDGNSHPNDLVEHGGM